MDLIHSFTLDSSGSLRSISPYFDRKIVYVYLVFIEIHVHICQRITFAPNNTAHI